MIVDIGKYYLYRHIRLDTNQVFYIGIGSKRDSINYQKIKTEYSRAYSKHERSEYWKNIVSKYSYKIEIILESNDYEFIKQKEIEFIALYGRKDLKKGMLCNMTDGGDGIVNYIASDELRKHRSDIRLLNKEDVINRLKLIYGENFKYEDFVYKGVKTKINVWCETHGWYNKAIWLLFRKKCCTKCRRKEGIIKRSTNKRNFHKNIIIDKFRKVHGEKYDYSKVEYTGNQNKVYIVCSLHGTFTTTPNLHLNGRGCKYCGFKSRNKLLSKKILVISCDTNEEQIFDSIKECALFYGISRSGIQYFLHHSDKQNKFNSIFKFYENL